MHELVVEKRNVSISTLCYKHVCNRKLKCLKYVYIDEWEKLTNDRNKRRYFIMERLRENHKGKLFLRDQRIRTMNQNEFIQL